jgi:hypothetical protein
LLQKEREHRHDLHTFLESKSAFLSMAFCKFAFLFLSPLARF